MSRIAVNKQSVPSLKEPQSASFTEASLGVLPKNSFNLEAAVYAAIEQALVSANPSLTAPFSSNDFSRTFTELGIKTPTDIRALKEAVCSSLGMSLPTNSVVDGRANSTFPTTERAWLTSQHSLGFPLRSEGLDSARTPRELAVFLFGADLASYSPNGMRVKEELIQRASCYSREELEETLVNAIGRWAVENYPQDYEREQFSSEESCKTVQDCLHSADSMDAVDIHSELCVEFGFTESSWNHNLLGHHFDTGETTWERLVNSLETQLRAAKRFIE